MGCCGLCTDEEHDSEVQEVKEVTKKEEFHGPIEHRRCRDSIMLIIFIAFWAGMAFIAVESLNKGEALRLLYGADSFGNLCGENNDRVINSNNSGLDLRGKKYLYYTDPTSPNALKLCVASCPNITEPNTGAADFECKDNTTYCQQLGVCLTSAPYGIYNDTHPSEADNDGCPGIVYETQAIEFFRRCDPIPGLSYGVGDLVSGFIDEIGDVQLLQDILADFVASYDVIGYCALVALGIAFVVIVLMRCMAAPLVYGLVLAGLGASTALTVFVYMEWRDVKDLIKETPEEQRLSSDIRSERFLYGFMIFCFVFTILAWLLVIALRNRIRLVVALFEEASKAMARMPQLYLAPIWTYIVMVAFLAYWLGVYAYLITSGEPTKNRLGHVQYATDDDYQKMWWYHLFGLFWIAQFILACHDIVLAGAIAAWYFTRDKSDLSYPYTKSIGRLVKYHLGSAAFGALIIAIVQLARAILAYIQKKLKDNPGDIASFILKCLSCCLWCFEKILKFINKNAYIEIAIYGYSFCTAARQAVTLLAANLLRVAVINSVGDFVLFILKLIVVGGTGVVAYFWIKDDEQLHYYGVIIFVVCIFAYFIADVFIDVYEMAVDTIFLCFAEDSSRNNGKDKPYYMSDNLLKFMKANATNKVEKFDESEVPDEK